LKATLEAKIDDLKARLARSAPKEKADTLRARLEERGQGLLREGGVPRCGGPLGLHVLRPDLTRGLIGNICDEGSFDGSGRSWEVFG